MAKLTLADVSNLLGNPTSAANTINNNSSLIEAALENTLSRDGTSPNQMNADLDLNHNALLNVDSLSIDDIVLDGESLLQRLADETSARIAGDLANSTALSTGLQAERIARQNADVALASLIGRAGAVETVNYDTQIAASLATIPTTVMAIRTGGYNTAGDFGSALYRRVSIQPTHSLYFADFAGNGYWENAESTLTLYMGGALGDGVTDDSDAFEKVLTANRPIVVTLGDFLFTRQITSDHPISLTGLGSSFSKLSWSAGATNGGGLAIIAGDSTDRTLISNVGFYNNDAALGTALQIDYTGTSQDSTVRARTRVLVNGLDVRGHEKGSTTGWLNGLEIINSMYAYVSDMKFLGYLTSASGPYPDSKAMYFHGESGSNLGPVSHYCGRISVSNYGTGLQSEHLEGVYLDVFDFVNVDKGVIVDNGDTSEPGLTIRNGHINSFSRGIELNNSLEFNISNVLFYVAASKTSDYVCLVVRGSSSQTGLIEGNQFKWIISSYNSTAIQIQAGSNISIGWNQFNIQTSTATALGIEVQSAAVNTDIAKQKWVNASSRISNASSSTTFEELFTYTGSVDNFIPTSRRHHQVICLASGASGLPSGISADGTILEVFSRDGSIGHQILYPGNTSSIYRRRYASSAWTAWATFNPA